MNKLIAATSILAFIASSFVYINQDKSLVLNSDIPQEVVLAFDQWKLSQKRLYSTPQEQNHRLRVFYDNYKLVEEVNSKKLGYTFGLNDFSDLSSEEFNAKYLQKPIKVESVAEGSLGSATFEGLTQGGQDFNWCQKGYCSAVRLQGNCAAGYAFAAAKAIEYSNNIVGRSSGKWLSPQELIDCSGNFGNAGCSGGYVSNSITYAMNYGLNFDANYPYTDFQGPCKGTSKLFKPANYFKINRDINSFDSILKQTPFSVGVDASTFQFYKSGVFFGNGCSSDTVTHFLTMIGNGITADGQYYWRLENSWGTSWGQNGYMFLSANYNGFTNVCGILNLGVANVLTN